MIISLGDANTADLYHGMSANRIRRFSPEIIKTALRKLDMVNAAGDLAGKHSIRVNEQWRIVFAGKQGTPMKWY